MNAAYEHNNRRIDRAAFYAIACDPRRSVAVEACAGAGKTWMLVSRIVRALLDGAQPQEILAITFTKKAASEMRKRLHEWLAQWVRATPAELAQELAMRGLPNADAATCEKLKQLYPQLLAGGRAVQVRTFHSWFAALLGSAPLSLLEQLGLPARYELLLNDKEAVARVWRRFHVAIAAMPQERRDYEESVTTYGRFQTLKALGVALGKRVEFEMADAHGAVYDSVKPVALQFPEFAAAATLDDIVGLPQVQPVLLDAARVLGRGGTATSSDKGTELEKGVSARDLDAVLLALLTKEMQPRKFSEKLAGLDAVRAAQALALRMCAARCQHEAWLHHQRMARLARVLLREFAALKREHGWIDMNDVERAALHMLTDDVLSGWIQERLDAQVRHLLIDEFQDTNPMQWQALGGWLHSYAGAGKAPSVFIVGDPKQSIYRFRRAEPLVFKAAQEFIVDELGGDLLCCDHTYRNAPGVLNAVNAVFDVAQRGYEFDGFRAHTTESRDAGEMVKLPQVPRSAKPAREGEREGLQWRDSLSEPRETAEEKLATLECRQAAAWIAAQLAGGTRPKDILVLARKGERIAEMQDVLREMHIPAQQPEKTGLGDAPEVQDIVALLDVLVSPGHDLSLARALKSPLFGASDADLVALALRARAGDQSVSWQEALMAPGDLPAALEAARSKLAGWKSCVDSLPPHDALEQIYLEGDVLARFAAAAPAALRDVTLANLRALLGASLQVQGGRYLTPYAFVRALKAGGIEAPAVAKVDVVRLLTVHGAKGLEASVVVLLDADGTPPPSETMGVLCEWPAQAPAPWRFAFITSETRPPPCSEDFLRIEQDARRREELNGLYVAMTRAEHRLVISSVEPYRATETTWWTRLEPLAEDLDAPAVSGCPLVTPTYEVTIQVLPEVALPPVAVKEVPEDSEIARFGSAMHRLLEFAVNSGGGFPPARLRRVGREFGLDAAQVKRAADMAARILQGDGAWAWDARQVDWQGNEVELFHAGETLRLDRLVRRADSGEWWVLDYKSHATPEEKPQLLEQMRLYREAVQLAYPQAAVRAAFLTGQGRLVAVD